MKGRNWSERARMYAQGSNAMRNAGGAARHEIIAAHLEFLEDPALNERSGRPHRPRAKAPDMRGGRRPRGSIAALEALDDSRMKERADDLLDIEAHVLLALAGEARPMHMPLPEQAVLIADDLLPSEITALDRRRLVAICLSGGGTTSHVAILAAAMEVPMLVGLGAELRKIADGQTLIVDADAGLLHISAERGSGGEGKVDGREPDSRAAPRCAWRRRPNAVRSMARASRCSPISAMSATRLPRSPMAPKAAGCCAPNSCSSIEKPRRPRTNNCRVPKHRRRPRRATPDTCG